MRARELHTAHHSNTDMTPVVQAVAYVCAGYWDWGAQKWSVHSKMYTNCCHHGLVLRSASGWNILLVPLINK